jgi:ribosomal protein S18 acetylase RimI-like enzyme
MDGSETGEMWVIAVLKEFENQRVGRTLMTLVEDWLFSKGCAELWLTTDPDENFRAFGFYRTLGWKDWKIEHGDRFMKKIAPPKEGLLYEGRAFDQTAILRTFRAANALAMPQSGIGLKDDRLRV